MRVLSKKKILNAAIFLAVFVLWTVALRYVDVQEIGPQGSRVGLATLNGWFHSFTGVHLSLYTITDWLGLVPFFTALAFAILGLVQWIGRKSLFRVDRSLFVLGGFYILVIAAYLFFEAVPLNFRPVLIEGRLEASYPSSTTLLSLCVMPTAWIELRSRIKNDALKRIVFVAIAVFTAFMVVARLISGVHWLTDIIGGALLSAALVALYVAFAG